MQASRADDAQPAAAAEAEAEEAWECVGRRRNESFVARTHADASTPVTDIFGARCCCCLGGDIVVWVLSSCACSFAGGVTASVVKSSGVKPSVTQEPFKILSLVRLPLACWR